MHAGSFKYTTSMHFVKTQCFTIPINGHAPTNMINLKQYDLQLALHECAGGKKGGGCLRSPNVFCHNDQKIDQQTFEAQ